MKVSKNQGKEVKNKMCRCCYAMEEYNHQCMHKPIHHAGFLWSIMDVEEEIKILEECKETLTKRLEEVNKRLEALKR